MASFKIKWFKDKAQLLALHSADCYQHFNAFFLKLEQNQKCSVCFIEEKENGDIFRGDNVDPNEE